MNPRIQAIILGLLFVLAYWLIWITFVAPRLYAEEPYNREHDPRYHGADALLIGWKGKITALRWIDGRYIAMWKRK